MLTAFFVAVDTAWLNSAGNLARLASHRSPLGIPIPALEDRSHLFIKFRGAADGLIRTDTELCRLQNHGGESFIASSALANELSAHPSDARCVLFYFEGSSTMARCVYYPAGEPVLNKLQALEPGIRLEAHDLPPARATLVEGRMLVRSILRACAEADAELFAPQASHFLNGPHILDQLLTHLFELKVDEAPNFLTVTKGIADQLRGVLSQDNSSTKIQRVERSHAKAWEEVYGSTVTFIDGGAARLSAMPGVEPGGMRVGSYSVIPGETAPEVRETFRLETRLIAEMTEGMNSSEREPDRKRLQEASRYVLELLTTLVTAESEPVPEVVYLHGPLVNQFVAYDDDDPNNLPGLAPQFLNRYGIDQGAVTARVDALPLRGGAPRWNQFMAVYGYLLKRLEEKEVPVAGVVERSTGGHVTGSILEVLRKDRVVNEAYVRAIEKLITRYRITDSFLFGCLLAEGEYLTPVRIHKNNERRAHEEWKPVVRNYLSPFATVLKPSEAMPPIRIELNAAASSRAHFLARLTYHTSRLLPRYAFPVGLDIVDKYAKVPDWISRGVSATMAASILRRAMRDGDARAFAQVRHFLAGEPRDFFFRPGV
jgi:hypothetical protein